MHDPKRLEGRKPYFILNDFDLATFVNPDGTLSTASSSKHLTGTLPFMARDILKNPFKPHYLRHDLESAVYIDFWIGASYPFGANGQPMKRNQALMAWEEGNFSTISSLKTNFLLPGESFASIWKTIAADFKPYGHWFLALRNVFGDAFWAEKARTRAKADENTSTSRGRDKEDETMYGAITPAKIVSALDEASLRAGLRDEVNLFVE
ncbi:hypothetical protein C8Q75DRAFT_756618 [Abortiporus biennis]|nr:hypothetical protein C8Q75DRAFT_756618 [Abortiporus biennis]